MPQNIVVGDEAESVASFIAEYSGTDVEEPPLPEEGSGSGSESSSGAESGSGSESSSDSASGSGSESGGAK
jgi:hypothetical protein